MRIEREYPRVVVSKKGERWLDSGHPWCYGSDVVEILDKYNNGDIVDVISPKGKYLGTGLLSLTSKIRVRIFSKDASTVIDDSFWKRRIEYALSYRQSVLGNLNACRLIFGESDYFPGLTVDKYNDILVTQIVTYGMEQLKPVIFPLLFEALNENGFKIKGIYERNDVAIRKLEGLDEYCGWYGQQLKEQETIINENNLKIVVNYVEGQKTGYFLDQRDNRRLVGEIAKNKRVLDCFCHTGSFALNCALNGASKVTAVDVSEKALKQARTNAELNYLDDKIDFVCADVFDYLDRVNKKDYEFIILDPPAFTKSRKTIKSAYNGYLEINLKAIKLLGRGGYLATCSCSHFMNHELFEKMLKEASYKSGFDLKQISVSQQAKDHPILWNVPETDYLKFYIFQII